MGLDSRQFLSKLQGDLAAGSIEIAGFPDTCVRLLVELKDDFVSTQTLERLVRSDPALSQRVISMANSAAYQSSTGPTTTLSGAIARIGLAALRTVVLAYAFASLRDMKLYKPVQGRMGDIWARCVALATFARALSLQVEGRRVDRDAMILGGMLSGVGKIYLLAEMAAHEEVLNDFAAVEHLLQTWHVKLTRTMLKGWEFPDSVVRAATNYESARDPSSDDPVTDLLYVAGIFVDAKGDASSVASRLPLVAPAMRLGLATVNPEAVLGAAAQEAASFGGALA
ncbi:MAG: HDOD domain-containing protein [Gammaproteobacteria bacterium]|jgi:HD-like signal output (HDOD) protein|nr:HDOD domain-containing protein [Gammaproteobacteria bacterium]